jgi:hypothetical protein
MKPYTCPVCNGRKRVPSGFYNTSGFGTSSTAVDEECRTCNGSGIVWGPSESPQTNYPTWFNELLKNIEDPQSPRPSGEPETPPTINY